jgi:hypothetical protein
MTKFKKDMIKLIVAFHNFVKVPKNEALVVER